MYVPGVLIINFMISPRLKPIILYLLTHNNIACFKGE
jgi:hypothetical protein